MKRKMTTMAKTKSSSPNSEKAASPEWALTPRPRRPRMVSAPPPIHLPVPFTLTSVLTALSRVADQVTIGMPRGMADQRHGDDEPETARDEPGCCKKHDQGGPTEEHAPVGDGGRDRSGNRLRSADIAVKQQWERHDADRKGDHGEHRAEYAADDQEEEPVGGRDELQHEVAPHDRIWTEDESIDQQCNAHPDNLEQHHDEPKREDAARPLPPGDGDIAETDRRAYLEAAADLVEGDSEERRHEHE